MVNRLRQLAVALIALLMAIPAAAQNIETQQSPESDGVSFEELHKRIKPDQTIYVLDPQGRESEGKLVRLSGSSLTVTVLGAEREFARDEVTRVARRGDSVSNGTAIGAGIFAGWALVSMATQGCASEFGIGGCAGLAGFMAGIGAGIGALVDYSVKGRTVVYRRPTGPKAYISPILAPSGGGVRLSLQF